jgi:hypothetical protein
LREVDFLPRVDRMSDMLLMNAERRPLPPAVWLVLLLGLVVSGCRTAGPGTRPAPQSPPVERKSFTLSPSAVWQLELPDGKRFDASGLLLRGDGSLLTLSDQEPALYRLDAPTRGGIARLEKLPGFFAADQLAPFKQEKKDRYDVEGLGQDAMGNIYVSEEANRWILRFPPNGSRMERLPIDWSPVARYFDPKDDNASFEGVGIVGRTMFVANERNLPRILRVDLDTMKVVGDFSPAFNIPLLNEAHYSDLSVWRGHLFVLVRSRDQILEIDTATEQVLAEYDAGFADHDPEYGYITRYGTGNMEGLAIDAGGFWLITDNNGEGRKKYPADIRPTLFRCPWPKGAEAPPRR